MIQLTGKLIDISASSKKDYETGEISIVHSAEILHKVSGKSEIESLKIDPSVLDSWTKAIGRDISAEIRFYAMLSKSGSLISGKNLADKKSLPVVHRPTAAPAAA